MKKTYLPLQFKQSPAGIQATMTIEDTPENRTYAKEMMCKLLNVKAGKVTFGPPMTLEEAVAYNQGYEACMVANNNAAIVYAPELTGKNGEKITTQPKKRARK